MIADQRLALVDRLGRVWTWTVDFGGVGVFAHGDSLFTEQEIQRTAEPIIEIRDDRVFLAQLAPVAARDIRLNDWVILPVMGELSPVIGVWPVGTGYNRRLCVCTENGDWARRADAGLVLRAERPIPDRVANNPGACESSPARPSNRESGHG
jgi:hypothetical protein